MAIMVVTGLLLLLTQTRNPGIEGQLTSQSRATSVTVRIQHAASKILRAIEPGG